jgi:hypothetical protein
MTANPESPEERLRGDLMPGERLLWSGRPRTGLQLGWGHAVFFLLSLAWTALSHFAVRSFLAQHDREGLLVALAFAALGLFGLVGAAPLDARSREATAYGLTDRRAIVVEGLLRRRVRRLPLGSLAKLDLKERDDRSGTITCFSTARDWPHRDEDGDRSTGPLFRLIEDAGPVFDLIVAARADAERSARWDRRAEHGAGH